MRSGLESIKPLDANVEKRNLEGTYTTDKINTQKPKMTSWELLEETHKRDQERKTAYALGLRFGGLGLSNSEDPFKPLPKPKFSAIDIGKETINTPTKDKKEAQKVESELEVMMESSLDGLDK